MSVCPNCGESIISCWRQNRWRTNVFFLQWDQTNDIDPAIWVALKKEPKQIQIDKYYAYRNAGRVIERILISEYNVGGKKAFSVPREHVSHKRPDRKQTKLIVNEAKRT